MEHEPPPIPRRIAWFTPWTWPLWLRFAVGAVVVFVAVVGFALMALMLLPFDIYIHDTYINNPASR